MCQGSDYGKGVYEMVVQSSEYVRIWVNMTYASL